MFEPRSSGHVRKLSNPPDYDEKGGRSHDYHEQVTNPFVCPGRCLKRAKQATPGNKGDEEKKT